MKEEQIRCQAVTCKGQRCRNRGTLYRKHTDGHEYLSCKLHFRDFQLHSSQKGKTWLEAE